MNFLENVKETASDVAGAVVKKTVQITDTAKKKYNIYDIKTDVKNLYVEIGKLTYLAVEEKEDHTESIQMKCAIIKEKLEKIKKLEASMGDGSFKCPVCGKPTDTEGYCSSCGSSVEDDISDYEDEE